MHVQGSLEKRDHAEVSPGCEVGRCALGRKSETSETLQEALGVPAPGKHHQPVVLSGQTDAAVSQTLTLIPDGQSCIH